MFKPLAVVFPLLISASFAPLVLAQDEFMQDELVEDDFALDHAEKNAEIESTIGNVQGFMETYLAVQAAVEEGNAETLADLMDYPLSVQVDGQDTYYSTAEDFIANYAKIVTPVIEKALMDQDYDRLFVSDNGVMVGDGAVWFTSVCADGDCEKTRWAVTNFNS